MGVAERICGYGRCLAVAGAVVAASLAMSSPAGAGFKLAPEFGTKGRAFAGLGQTLLPTPSGIDLGFTVFRQSGQMSIFRTLDGYPDGTFARINWLDADGREISARSRAWLPNASEDTRYRSMPDGSTLVALGRKVTRLKPDGAKDTAFGNDGVVELARSVQSLSAYPSGGFVAVSSPHREDAFLERFDEAGDRIFKRKFNYEGLTVRSYGSAGEISVGAWDWESYDGYGTYEGDETPKLLSPQGEVIRSFPKSYTSVQFLPDGRYLAGEEGEFQPSLFVLNEDFSRDPSFDPGLIENCPGASTYSTYQLQVDSQGRFLAYRPSELGTCALTRHLPDGSIDATFSVDGSVNEYQSGIWGMRVDGQDRPILVNWPSDERELVITRLTSDGELDTDFGTGGETRLGFTVPEQADRKVWVDVQADGRLVTATTANRPGYGRTGLVVRRLTRFGRIDTSFGEGGLVHSDEVGWGMATGIATDRNGRVFVSAFSGQGGQNEREYRAVLLAFDNEGIPDPGFGGDGVVAAPRSFGGENNWFKDVTVDRAGRPVVVGSVTGRGEKGNERDWIVARYTRAGKPDPTFGHGGIRVLDVSGIGRRPTLWTDMDSGLKVRLAGDGKLVLGGRASERTSTQFAAVRLNPDGTLDRNFGDRGLARYSLLQRLSKYDWWAEPVRVSDIAVGPDGRVAISSGFQVERMSDGGYGTDYVNQGAVVLLNRSGRPIRSFGMRGFLRNFVDVQGLAFDRCNRLIIGGSKAFGPAYRDRDDFSLSRFTSAGKPDLAFAPKGTRSFQVGRRHESFLSDVVVKGGRIFASGQSVMPNGNRGMAVSVADSPGKCR